MKGRDELKRIKIKHFTYIFIAVLVLAKDKEVEIIQDGLFTDIYVEGKV